MKDIDITLYFNEYRLKAVQDALADEGFTLKDKLNDFFNFLYEQFVPVEQQTVIEAQIKEQTAVEQAEAEARKRFAVFHISENGEDSYFTSEHFQTFLSAAYRYRLYVRDELSAEPQAFADAFLETKSITNREYESLCDRAPNDIRIKALLDFDLDNEQVSVCGSSDNTWWTYSLHDVSVAAYKAMRSDYRASDDRLRIFESALVGKELDIGIAEETGMIL